MMIRVNKKIVHIFPRSFFLDQYHSALINAKYNPDEHIFLIYGGMQHPSKIITENDSDDGPMIICIDNTNDSFIVRRRKLFNLRIAKILNTADLIICHSLNDYILELFILHPNCLKKVVWRIWGYDISDYLYKSKSFVGNIRILVKRMYVKRIPYVILRKPEVELLWERYHVNPMSVGEPAYGFKKDINLVDYAENNLQSTQSKKCYNIVIGNAATPTAGHIEVLDKLTQYRGNIQIYLPLVYGDKKYANSVIQYACSKFGNENVHVLDKGMNIDEYRLYLFNMDIGIYNHSRQGGMGNISTMLSLGKKVYLNDKAANWNIYNGYGYSIYPISELPSIPFNSFVEMSDSLRLKNIQLSKSRSNLDKFIQDWKNVFELNPIKRK